MDPVTGGIIKAGIGLLGGLFGRKKKTTETQTKVDYNHIREGARAAGFNPLTALRNGGSANATTTTTAPAALSSAEFIADAVGQGIEIWSNRDNIRADAELKKLETQIAKAELENLKKSGALAAPKQSFGYDLTKIKPPAALERYGPKLGAQAVRPQARPTKSTMQRIPVYLAGGSETPKMIPKDFADRMGLKPFGMMAAGEFEEAVGGGRAELEAGIMAKEVGQDMGIPLWGEKEYDAPKLSIGKSASRRKSGMNRNNEEGITNLDPIYLE